MTLNLRIIKTTYVSRNSNVGLIESVKNALKHLNSYGTKPRTDFYEIWKKY